MKTATLVAALALAAAPAIAQDNRGADAQPLQVVRDTDASLTCPQISEEAAQLSEGLGGDTGGGVFGRLGGVAKAGAAMVIPGAGLVTAAADALTQPGRERREAAEASARHRWWYLNGLYAGHRCDAQAEAAMNPAPAPSIDPAPAMATAPSGPADPAAAPAIAPVSLTTPATPR